MIVNLSEFTFGKGFTKVKKAIDWVNSNCDRVMNETAPRVEPESTALIKKRPRDLVF